MNPDSLFDSRKAYTSILGGVFSQAMRNAVEVEQLRTELLALGLTEDDLEALRLYSQMTEWSERSLLVDALDMIERGRSYVLAAALERIWEEVTRP